MDDTRTTSNPSDETKAVQTSLLQLPLELRRMIYWQSILVARRPTPEQVHQRNFGAIWEDIPSPLLSANKHVRTEVFDVLQKRPFTMRVTSYGAEFDMLGLSCFIAQQRPRSYCDLPCLVIDIWPPHPDRPIEMYYIRCRLREVREELRAASGIQELLIYFSENDLAKWTHDGGPRHDLSEPRETDPLRSDFAKMLDHFACVTNVTKARIRLPPSLERNEQNDTLRWHAMDVMETMQGDGTLADEQSSTLADYEISDMDEKHFKRLTAQKARVKLDAITLDGLDKMSEVEWHAFTEVWPHFETLTEWEEGGVFKGEWHYMMKRTTSPDSSAWVHTDAWVRRL